MIHYGEIVKRAHSLEPEAVLNLTEDEALVVFERMRSLATDVNAEELKQQWQSILDGKSQFWGHLVRVAK